MGGGGRAGAEVPELVFLNPAVAALAVGMEAGFFYRDGYWADGEHDSDLAVSLVENSPGNFTPGGFAYLQRRRTLPGMAWMERYIHAAFAQSMNENITFGVSVYNLQQVPDVGTTHIQWNGSVAALYTVNPQMGFAYVLTNPAGADHDIPVPMRAIMQQSFAMNMVFTDLIRVTADFTRWEKLNPEKKWIMQLGGESRVSDFGLVRFGYELDDIQKRNTATFGIGFNGPRLRANYSISKPLRGTDGAMHSVDMRIPF